MYVYSVIGHSKLTINDEIFKAFIFGIKSISYASSISS